MLNFSVGPVTSYDYLLKIGGEQVPYFRTAEFSEIMFENERLMLEFMGAPQGSRAVFLTGSGTAAMEAAVINTLSIKDKAIVVNGGSFGQRFCELLSLHKIPYDAINLDCGEPLSEKHLIEYDGKGYTAFLVNICETSTGILYDKELIADFCKRNGAFLIVDAISSFLADSYDMEKTGADVTLTGSQKALACAPGVSVAVLSPRGLKRTEKIDSGSMYLDFKSHLKNGERGQTPFTPAVGTLLQINARLKAIKESGGVKTENDRIKSLAEYFRGKIKGLPFDIQTDSLSYAVTPLYPKNASAYEIFSELKDNYGIWVCPNGGEFKDKIFRVGHIGANSFEAYDELVAALQKLLAAGRI